MTTRMLGVVDLERTGLRRDLAILREAKFSTAYADFACGRWELCMLRNRTGLQEEETTVIHDGAAAPTPLGRSLSYIDALLERHFAVEHVRYARVMRIADNACIIPHRDYLELEAPLVRLHLPLETNRHAANTEDDRIFWMQEGEVWFLDASRVHSAGCFSAEPRQHLVVDLDGRMSPEALVRNIGNPPALPPQADRRAAFGSEALAGILGLSAVISEANYRDIVAILAKIHFHYQVDCADMYGWLKEICRRRGDPALIAKTSALERFYLLARGAGEVMRY